MTQAITVRYRLAVASRALAAIFGGYGLAALSAGCFSLALIRWVGMPRSEAVVTATLLAFVWYVLAVIWVFATRNAWRAWAGLAVPCAIFALGWWAMGGQA
ncbi:DUF3649 domain-containing protein [Cupriavidus plantarum]|uniref:DUF3649 domain-containing protein n=1 Tax=Cupriavidus plantarum TaxID=942865 RepID=UPI000E27D24B|nr:DUF3649 domain-containing protein [Cupriavidus plantarum]REF01977.1 uncharacterized protein DUF3649 [Cupriavidus plantarum]